MNNLKFVVLITIILFVTFSCNKEDDEPEAVKTNAELIIGTWRWSSTTENDINITLTNCDLLDTASYNGTLFTSVVYYSDNGNEPCTSDADTFSYSVNGNSIVVVYDTIEVSSEITTLNQSTLAIKYIRTDGNIYIDTYIKL